MTVATFISPTCIMTQSGVYVEPLDLDPDTIRIEDIAFSLAGQYRFTAHTRLSVAEHCVRCVRALREEGYDDDILRWTLLHDASEYVLVDIPRPLKADPYFGKAYRGAEDRIMRRITEHFGLPPKMPPIVRDIDIRMLATERRDLLPETPGQEWEILEGVEPLTITIRPWSSKIAERRFLAEYERLFGKAL